MKKLKNYCLLALFLLTIVSLPTNKTIAQNKPKWYVTAGAGVTALRDFNSTFKDLQYSIMGTDASIDYRLNSKPDFLINGGFGLSGTFQQNGILGWNVGLNMRSGGFQLTPELLEKKGLLPYFYHSMLPEFGKTKKFRYWAMHIPVTLTYLPFQYVGFTLGADLYYQFSSNITDSQLPHGKLGETMGFTTFHAPKYQHPFQVGAHVGIFAPINERLRLDLDFFTDISPRLKVSSVNRDNSTNFREMGVKLNMRYYLK